MPTFMGLWVAQMALKIVCIIVLHTHTHTQRDTQHLENLESGFDSVTLG